MLQRWYPDGYLSIYSDGFEPTRDHPRFRLIQLLYDVVYFYTMFCGLSPRIFSQVATSQGYFPKCAISQAATSLICPSRSARPPPASSSRSAHPPIAACGALEGLT